MSNPHLNKYLVIAGILILYACSDPQKVIKIKGSDTEVNLAVSLAENFNRNKSGFSVAISGGGSGLGIASLLNGQADIANSSRPLNDEEKDLFNKKHIKLNTVVFAEDATAFIVHKNFPLDSITVEDLAKVMNGEYATWKVLTGKDVPVTIYGRQSNSGTHSFIQKKLNIDFSPHAKEMNGNAQIMEGVKMDTSAIGYVGAGYITGDAGPSKNVKVLKISSHAGATAISPLDEHAIKEHRYFFQRPLYQFIPVNSWNKVQLFIAYEMGTAGRALIKKEGYYNVQQ